MESTRTSHLAPRALPIHVTAAALVDAAGRVLVTRRPAHKHQGGLWEFPGGKLEADETVEAALARELHEELGVTPRACRPLIRIRHDYPDRSVLLEVWRVGAWDGEPHGREGQPLDWRLPEAMDPAEFPAADVPIITALRLPDACLVTPEPGADHDAFLARLEAALARGVRLVQLRARTLDQAALAALYRRAHALTAPRGVPLLLNAAPELARALDADGVHLSGAELARTDARPLPPGWRGRARWVGASCHDAAQLARAAAIGADFALLGPVQPTASHPGQPALGWDAFARLAGAARIPIYGIGGLSAADRDTAWAHGAQGIAAIRGLWEADGAS